MLEIRNLTKQYGDERAIDELSLSIDDGEFCTILGPSGSGKTTTLLSIAGHVTPTAGSIALEGTDLTDVPPEDRSLGIVFQQDALFEHMTARENVAYALGPHEGDWDRETRIDQFLSLVGMSDYADSYPEQLSGGQRRRIELARALVYEPDVLLLDEPLTGLDRQLRREMRAEISRIHEETNVTTVYVTHDQSEALTLSDRIAVLNEGACVAVGTPEALYEQPPNRFVTRFLGSVSTLPGTIVERSPLVVEWAGYRFELGAVDSEGVGDVPSVGDRFRLYCRPDAVRVEPSTGISVDGEVTDITHSGERSTVTIETTAGGQLRIATDGFPNVAVGETVTAGIDPDAVFGFAGDSRLCVSTASRAENATDG
ncbi:ABC transporter ATP-binding protein [Halobacteriaceae archaeon SHR40]|uniref:ABC transporter ATP-binding protein n=1 Tax=Halovenus amylolytica TaxID=2500550 RepID=UPI000FE35496